MAASSALDLIPATATCRFVGEGRANLVFTLAGADVDADPNLKGQLLRLPKHNYRALPYPDLQHYWETKVKPLFAPNELVQQRLVRLPIDSTKRAAFFAGLNAQLRELDASGTRRSDFVGHAVKEDVEIGMLVEDMRSSSSSGSPTAAGTDDTMQMHEIKPKWLHQSPRAPPGAPQCRNCAREVWRHLQNGTRAPVFCPLNLLKPADFAADAAVARDVAAELARCLGMGAAAAAAVARWLRSAGLLRRLRRAQWALDHAPAPAPADDAAYSLAMTLRDCSLFVLVSGAPDAEPARVVAKLGDTDMKNFAVKKDYWMKMEKQFHESGVYWNTGELSASLTACQLPFYRNREGVEADSELGRYYLA